MFQESYGSRRYAVGNMYSSAARQTHRHSRVATERRNSPAAGSWTEEGPARGQEHMPLQGSTLGLEPSRIRAHIAWLESDSEYNKQREMHVQGIWGEVGTLTFSSTHTLWLDFLWTARVCHSILYPRQSHVNLSART
jgi:hypothetical protein